MRQGARNAKLCDNAAMRERTQPFNISFIGQTGSGKGTQAGLLAQRLLNVVHIITGDLMRALAKEDSVLGRKVAEILDAGGLPPVWTASFLWEREIFARLAPDKHLIMDGAPRRLEEAQLLDEILLAFDRAPVTGIFLRISEAEALRRLKARGRDDDDEKTIANRFAYFSESVMPMLEYYRGSARLIEINGEQSIGAVQKDIRAALGIV